MSTDPSTKVAALVIPWPDREDEDDLVFNDMCRRAVRDRLELADQLRLAWHEGDADPVLIQILHERRAMLQHEQTLRALLAFAREFISPRPYTLGVLAEASGMSISGIRTAYGDEEVEFINRQLRTSDITI